MYTKKLTALFASMFLLLNMVLAQGWEKIYSTLNVGENTQIREVIPQAGGDAWLLIDRTSDNGQLNFQIAHVDAAGAIITIQNINSGQQVVAFDMIQTADGGFVVTYQATTANNGISSYLMKLDAQLNTVFNSQVDLGPNVSGIQPGSILEIGGKLCLSGEVFSDIPVSNQYAPFFKIFDASGNPLGQYVAPFADKLTYGDVCASNDGNLLLLTTHFESGATYQSLRVSKVDIQNYSLLWNKEYSNPSQYRSGKAIRPAIGGGYIIAGSANSHGLLVKTDEAGVQQWEKVFPIPNTPEDFLWINFIEVNADQTGYWALSQTNSYLSRWVLLNLDAQGELLSQHTYGPEFAFSSAYDLVVLPDNSTFASGSLRKITNNNSSSVLGYLVHADANGAGFQQGVSGKISFDYDNDCTPNVDTTSFGIGVVAWQNGVFAGGGTAGNNGDYFIPLAAGAYAITVDKQVNTWEFCPDTAYVTVLAADTTSGVDFNIFNHIQLIDSLYGVVFDDADGDCVLDPFETVYPGWTVKAQFWGTGLVQTFTAVTDANGHYSMTDLNGLTNQFTGLFTLIDPAGDGLNCHLTCPSAINFINGTTLQTDFGVSCDTLPPCAIMEVDVAALNLRPCFYTSFNVRYCNAGALYATGAYVDVTLAPELQYISATIPGSLLSGNTYRFQLGDLSSEQCGDFNIVVFLPCSEPTGKTYCVEAHGYPDVPCQTPAPNWDGSQIEITASCQNGESVFTIHNNGVGDMAQPLEYIVIEDNVLLMSTPGTFNLGAGQSITLPFLTQGDFIRVQAAQSPGFPSLTMPSAWLEGCGGTPSTPGLINAFPFNDNDPWLDVFCMESVNSYDPNDKNGFPRGYDAEHFIDQNTDIEYLIRFQNTGTADAINVVLRDTLDWNKLDPKSVRPGASSHPYQFDIQENGIVVFTFNNIFLPDSASNEAASHGFVKFRVSQQKDVELGSIIENSAAIYFDNNSPVITNSTWHTIGKNFILTDQHTPVGSPVQVSIMPNPVSEMVHITVGNLPLDSKLQFGLYNAVGQQVMQQNFEGNFLEWNAKNLPEGVYFYEISTNGGKVATGKLVKN